MRKDTKLAAEAAAGLILHRPYWRRAWIRQEVSVPRSDPLIQCGNRELPWHVLTSGLCYLFDHLHDARFHVRGISNGQTLAFMRKAYHGTIHRGKSADNDGPETNLYSLLHYSRTTLATDPRDQIYALLGLVKATHGGPDPDLMLPDYTKPVSWTYLEAAKMFIKFEGTLEFLSLRATHAGRSWLPSWVPDFSSSYRHDKTSYPSNAPNPFPKSSALGLLMDDSIRPFPCVAEKNGSALAAKGAILDRVIGIFETKVTSPEVVFKLREAVLSKNRRRVTKSLSGAVVIQSELEDWIWRTLIRNRGQVSSAPCPPEYGDYYSEILNDYQRGESIKPTTDGGKKFVRAMQNATSFGPEYPSRRILLFKGLDIGLGPPDAEPGDLLCLLGGYSAPVVLRPFGEFFQFVGDVYVHGIMNGEALADHELPLKFVIR